MKKILLGIYLSMFSFACFGQVIFYVEEPAAINNNYTFTYADPGGGWTLTPDLMDPNNAVLDTLMLAHDGTTDDSLICNPVLNDLTGKIAVLYRGVCQFGLKAYYAQEAGAVAVIIINHSPGVIGMAPGDSGHLVTVPLVMISDADGALLRAQLDAGQDVIAFIGNKTGYYADDLGFFGDDIYRPKAFSNPMAFSADNTEYDVQPGAWVHNYGTNDQIGVSVNATITMGSTLLYDQTSSISDILFGDSAFFSLPVFSQTSYTEGYYELTYTVGDSTDQFMGDNEVSQNFMLSDSLFSMGHLDEITNLPIDGPHYTSSSVTTVFEACIHFQDPNASRMAAMGITFSGTTNDPAALPNGLDGEVVEVFGYEWAEQFTDLDDPNMTGITANFVQSGDYTYNGDLQGEKIYVPFSQPMDLVDNQRYLFCVQPYNIGIYIGYDNTTNYYQNYYDLYRQPVCPVNTDGTWYIAGFGQEVVPAISVRMSTALGVEEEYKVDITPYPNPTNSMITIPFKGITGNATLKIYDLSGKLIADQKVNASTGNLTINVNNIPNGNYIFNLNFENGTSSKFNVIISK